MVVVVFLVLRGVHVRRDDAVPVGTYAGTRLHSVNGPAVITSGNNSRAVNRIDFAARAFWWPRLGHDHHTVDS